MNCHLAMYVRLSAFALAVAIPAIGHPSPTTRAASGKPTLAAAMETSGIEVPPKLKDAAIDYLLLRLTETGRYAAAPGGQARPDYEVRARLLRLPDLSCALSLELMKRATSAVVARGNAFLTDRYRRRACDLSRLAVAMSSAVHQVLGEERVLPLPATRPTAQPVAVPTDSGPKVAITLATDPRHARIVVNGRFRGYTPRTLLLPQGKPVAITLSRRHYHPMELKLIPRRQRRMFHKLRLTHKGRQAIARATEWVAFGFGLGSQGSTAGVAARFRAFHVVWQHFFLTALDLTYVRFPSPGDDNFDVVGSVGTRLGYPLFWGKRLQHQLRLSLGLALHTIDQTYGAAGSPSPPRSTSLFSLSPGIEYRYGAANGHLPLGLATQFVLPVANHDSFADYPFCIILTFDLGLAFP